MHQTGVPNSDPHQIITHLVLVGLGLREGLGLGVGLGLGNQVAISTTGVIIWQGDENGHNTGNACPCEKFRTSPKIIEDQRHNSDAFW